MKCLNGMVRLQKLFAPVTNDREEIRYSGCFDAAIAHGVFAFLVLGLRRVCLTSTLAWPNLRVYDMFRHGSCDKEFRKATHMIINLRADVCRGSWLTPRGAFRLHARRRGFATLRWLQPGTRDDAVRRILRRTTRTGRAAPHPLFEIRSRPSPLPSPRTSEECGEREWRRAA